MVVTLDVPVTTSGSGSHHLEDVGLLNCVRHVTMDMIISHCWLGNIWGIFQVELNLCLGRDDWAEPLFAATSTRKREQK